MLPATGDIVYLGALPLAMVDPSTQAARDAAHDLAAATPLRLLTELSRAVPVGLGSLRRASMRCQHAQRRAQHFRRLCSASGVGRRSRSQKLLAH